MTTPTTAAPSITLSASALEDLVQSTVASILAGLTGETATPAADPVADEAAEQARLEKAAAKQAQKEAFFAAIHDPQTKADNADLAAWCREKGLVPNGRVWKLVKDGCADMRKLRAAAKKDAVDRDARKAERKAEREAAKAEQA